MSVATSKATKLRKRRVYISWSVGVNVRMDTKYHFMTGKSDIDGIGLGLSQLERELVNNVLASPTRLWPES